MRGVTRGDGVRGEVVTQNVRTIRSVPLRIKTDGEKGRRGKGEKKRQAALFEVADAKAKEIEVRGEVYLPNDVFEQINRERLEREMPPFANPRNAAAGTMRQLDSQIVAERRLNISAITALRWRARLCHAARFAEMDGALRVQG